MPTMPPLLNSKPAWRQRLLQLATVGAVLLTARLGLWQLDRVDQKQQAQAQLEARAALPALDKRTLAADEALWQRRVRLQGVWLKDRTVFLDNRPMQGRVGFFVVTPLRLSGRDAVVLVQRGWVPRDMRERSRLPDFETPAGEVLVEGRLQPTPSRVYQLGESGSERIRQNLDPVAFAAELHEPVLPLAVWQSAQSADDPRLLRDWAPPAIDVQRNYGYAFQWFALSALIVALYVWFQVIQPRRRHR